MGLPTVCFGYAQLSQDHMTVVVAMSRTVVSFDHGFKAVSILVETGAVVGSSGRKGSATAPAAATAPVAAPAAD